MEIIREDQTSLEELKCPYCGGGSFRHGKRYGKYTIKQKLKCRVCGSTFTEGQYPKSKFPAALRAYALTLYVEKKLSLRKVSEEIRARTGIYLSHGTVLNWVWAEGVVRHENTGGHGKTVKIEKNIPEDTVLGVDLVSMTLVRCVCEGGLQRDIILTPEEARIVLSFAPWAGRG